MNEVVGIMAVWNGERNIGPHMIRESIESIQAQTFDDWKLVIVDDGSTDDTFKIVEDYASKDNRIRILRLLHNHGVAFARNAGIDYARAYRPNFMCLQDSDDWSMPERFSKQVSFLKEHPEYMMAGCFYEVRDHLGNRTKIVNDLARRADRIYHNLINARCEVGYPMIRWEAGCAVGWFDPDNFPVHASDYDFYLKIGEKFNIGMVPEVLYAYRDNSDEYQQSLSYDKAGHVKDLLRALQLSRNRRQNGIA